MLSEEKISHQCSQGVNPGSYNSYYPDRACTHAIAKQSNSGTDIMETTNHFLTGFYSGPKIKSTPAWHNYQA